MKYAGLPNIWVTCIRYFISFCYNFIIPIFYYNSLIDDSRYWRNLEKYLIPTESINLNSHLLEHDGLEAISISKTKGHLDDTLTNFKIPLIDFMQLESATSVLGRGGYATVWKALYCGSPVAVKELHGEQISVDQIKLFFREAILSTKFVHPNILRFIGACVQPPEFLMIFEWCNRGDLGNYLRQEQKNLTQSSRFNLAMQACRALAFFHKKGLVHRDLKPSNFLVHVEGLEVYVKLADFGSCRSAYDKMPIFQGISPLFVAPEIRELIPYPINSKDLAALRGSTIMYGQEVDIFSLGWVLWAIFTTEDWKVVLSSSHKRIFTGWLPMCWNIQPQYREVIFDCWTTEPEKRPTIQEVYDALSILGIKVDAGGGFSLLSKSDQSSQVEQGDFPSTCSRSTNLVDNDEIELDP